MLDGLWSGFAHSSYTTGLAIEGSAMLAMEAGDHPLSVGTDWPSAGGPSGRSFKSDRPDQ